MSHKQVNFTIVVAAIGLLLTLLAAGCSSPATGAGAAAKNPAAAETPGAASVQSPAPAVDNSGNTADINAAKPAAGAPATAPVSVVVAGYINHGPMQPTVQAIKDVLSRYGDRLNVTWIDLATQEGQDYFQEHGLTAHMNVIINGTSSYQVNGKTVDFLWFEGQQWSKNDLDQVLAGLTGQ